MFEELVLEMTYTTIHNKVVDIFDDLCKDNENIVPINLVEQARDKILTEPNSINLLVTYLVTFVFTEELKEIENQKLKASMN